MALTHITLGSKPMKWLFVSVSANQRFVEFYTYDVTRAYVGYVKSALYEVLHVL